MTEQRDADRENETAEVTKNWRGDGGEEEASNRSVRKSIVLNQRRKRHVRGKVWAVLKTISCQVFIFNTINTWFEYFTMWVWCWWSSISYPVSGGVMQRIFSWNNAFDVVEIFSKIQEWFHETLIRQHTLLRGRVTRVLHSSVFRQEGAVWSCASYSALVYMLKPLWWLSELYRISLD